MRRVLLLLTVAAIAIIAVAAVASAKTETRFSVIASKGHGHRVGSHSFLVHGTLSQPGAGRVGRYAAKFTQRADHRLRIRADAVIRGEGALKAKGVVGRGDNRISIIGGSGEYNGAAGKLKIHNLRHGRARLEFIFVQ